jgi:hypothetical protein
MADVKVILEILIDSILDLQDKLEASETYRNSLLDRLTLSEELLREAAAAKSCEVLCTSGWYQRAKKVYGD